MRIFRHVVLAIALASPALAQQRLTLPQYTVNQDLVIRTLQYLGGRPYAEVAPLIAELQAEIIRQERAPRAQPDQPARQEPQ